MNYAKPPMDILSRLNHIDSVEANSPQIFDELMVKLYKDFTSGALRTDISLKRELQERINDWLEHRLPASEARREHIYNPPIECKREYSHTKGSKYHSIETPLEGEEFNL
ncbi:hypothetical protein HYO33_23220 [Vibrio parahaemolyticus]|nr:hypothetical protein [Vibrio parahaemolyticus O5:K30]ELA9214024.1 hypothetical protein [Vibrio parahaemolyticus]MBM4950831.1 hypothetical protein [Vibrio parahaemolyticus]HCE4695035.1 hypothetical protein [Vibrio parahaemolyticus]